MNIVDIYLAYANAFEETYEDNNWQRLAVYFSDDAEYDGAVGRDAVLEKLENAVNSMDKLMDSRTLNFQPPTSEGNLVRVEWDIRYTKLDCPDLAIAGREDATFEGNRIRILHDEISASNQEIIVKWMTENGAKLQG